MGGAQPSLALAVLVCIFVMSAAAGVSSIPSLVAACAAVRRKNSRDHYYTADYEVSFTRF